MLRRLSIQNFAIIDQLEIRFQPGLTAITGETGAGKSILVGALGLVLGNRADTAALFDREKKCIVEAEFDAAVYARVGERLQQLEIDREADLLVRREIAVSGKSRAFINDTPVTLTQLREITGLLVDLHQQFDTIGLAEVHQQRELLDALAGCTAEAAVFQQRYQHYHRSRQELNRLQVQQQQQQQELDYRRFLLDELQEAAFREQELEILEQEHKLLLHAEAIHGTLAEAAGRLQEGDAPLVQQVRSIVQRLQQHQSVSPALQQLAERLQSVRIELGDIASELNNLQQNIRTDEQRLQQVEERLQTGYRLLKKHHVQDTAGLLSLQAQLEGQLLAGINLDQTVEETEQQLAAELKELQKAAAGLHQQRKKVIPRLEENVQQLLHQVGMPNARLKVKLEPVELHAHGMDQPVFLFNANLPAGAAETGMRFEPLSKVASGGELSRLMLCLQSMVAAGMDLPTLIFDEIDTGISGEAARQVGLLLVQLAQQHQVITITHLPQIAARATTHFFVYKEQTGTAVHTRVRLLPEEEQVAAIARMLGGAQVSETTLATARELMGRNVQEVP
ncbi:MAG TPA: DNA repair protein RecN [Lacibacter sp.]|nr:DNA repair protein RecN [Lacibacter sp.]HMO87791.1 DNA repair protein RecN [Lacibacter sp.]HMP87756.1 DNA repair protein RecN [Lacibacter sp.]